MSPTIRRHMNPPRIHRSTADTIRRCVDTPASASPSPSPADDAADPPVTYTVAGRGSAPASICRPSSSPASTNPSPPTPVLPPADIYTPGRAGRAHRRYASHAHGSSSREPTDHNFAPVATVAASVSRTCGVITWSNVSACSSRPWACRWSPRASR
jgi:hypothetical protein